MLLDVKQSALVLVDYQSNLMPVMNNGDAVLDNAERIAQVAQMLKVPVILTEQNPNGLGNTVARLRKYAQQTLTKMHFDATEEGLIELVEKHARNREVYVVAGCEAHVCLLQTVLGLVEQEKEVWVVTDACTSRTTQNRDSAFDRLAGVGVELVTTEMVLFEWVRTCEHPKFKDILGLVKHAPRGV